MQKEGGTWLDCQVLTAHMQSFGAKEIERDKFQELLKNATDGF
jgi:Leu/Phe-tRNA-protein transferase